MYDVCYQIVR